MAHSTHEAQVGDYGERGVTLVTPDESSPQTRMLLILQALNTCGIDGYALDVGELSALDHWLQQRVASGWSAESLYVDMQTALSRFLNRTGRYSTKAFLDYILYD